MIASHWHGFARRGVSLQEKLDELITKKVEEASAGHKAELERIGKSSNFQLAALTATSTSSGWREELMRHGAEVAEVEALREEIKAENGRKWTYTVEDLKE